MAVTLLTPHPEAYTRYVLPRASGYEERDVRAYPLPPDTSFALLDAVCAELRAHGHAVGYTSKRERLVDWTATHRHNEHSHGGEDGWRPDPKAPTVLRFVGGGWDVVVTVDGVAHRLEARHLRMPRATLATVLRGRP